MRPKFQIFVSSTFEDLREERDSAIKAVLEMGHIPVGMEMFSAGDEEQWELIKRQIDDSDYYVVIVAHRYGSLDGLVSYTEKEYDYALSQRVPVLGFVIDQRASWPLPKMETDPDKRTALEKFKTKVQKKIVNFWTDRKDLHAMISVSLSKAITAYPRPGWIRATTSLTPEIANELTRLSKENAELRVASLASKTDAKQQNDDNEEAQRVIRLLKANKEVLSFRYTDDTDWHAGPEVTLHAIFETIAPLAQVEVTPKLIGRLLAVTFVAKENERNFAEWTMPKNIIGSYLANFRALGLIAPSAKKHAVKDTEEYWALTAKGERIHSAALVQALEERAIQDKGQQ